MAKIDNSLKVSEEFGLSSEEAVREYVSLNEDIMAANYPLIADEVLSRVSAVNTILDVGTGTGALAIAFAKRVKDSTVYGIDFSSAMLEVAKKTAERAGISNVRFKLSDAHNLLFPDESFGLVVSFGVLHHLHNLKQGLCQIKRVLRKGGCAFLYDLRRDAPVSVISEIAAVMPSVHRRGFLESVKGAVSPGHLEDILENLDVEEYRISVPSYSRRTIIKNKDIIRRSPLSGERFNRVLMEVYFRK